MIDPCRRAVETQALGVPSPQRVYIRAAGLEPGLLDCDQSIRDIGPRRWLT
jgi:hypothetical protein